MRRPGKIFKTENFSRNSTHSKSALKHLSKNKINDGKFPYTLYIAGSAKGVSGCIDSIKKTSYSLAEEFHSYKIFIYYHQMDEEVFKAWQKQDSNVHLIAEDPATLINRHHKPERLAVARTISLNSIHSHARINGIDPSKAMMVLMDLDERNFGPKMNFFNKSVFLDAMNNANVWDSVSFNREMYYDIWALRYERFDANVWAFNADSFALVKIIRRDFSRILNESHRAGEQYVPVLSAFNGFAIYKLHRTIGCEYSADCVEFRSKCNAGDCEHVAFHKCMRERNNAKILVHTNVLFTEVPKDQSAFPFLSAIEGSVQSSYLSFKAEAEAYPLRYLCYVFIALVVLVVVRRLLCSSKVSRRS